MFEKAVLSILAPPLSHSLSFSLKNPLMREAGIWINPDYIRSQVKQLTKQTAKNIIIVSDTAKLQRLILCHADAIAFLFLSSVII